ncbi:MAG: 50S ribosomal protein L4 [Bacillota bacterium]|jgi:large subunit ribosomal protein L4|nr:50S ribosomal protein L4 [Bacillota bacterium]HOL52144.1 50S ribosomal protein L4 [Bacillota bacterium]HOO30395.1 50S ribosomal protein L4 [Bacillota bacterium]HPQ02253.1 50S ribosomal protein L4 [Bacillota bacterium]HQD79446.1 50S ribosomal protein L4 [Bacillota bacterium]
MPKAPLFDARGNRLGEVELPEAVFGIEPNEHAVHEAVTLQLASRRSGTHSTKTISEVRGGGRKPWRQKGTGRARHGSRRSPIWVGGGVVFGPKPRKYGYTIPKKVRRLALLSALSSMAQENAVYVVDAIDLSEPSTKSMAALFEKIGAEKPLVVTDERSEVVEKSTRNIPGAMVLHVEGLNVYDIVNHTALVLTRDAVSRAEEAFA